jgi:hypothetical protein
MWLEHSQQCSLFLSPQLPEGLWDRLGLLFSWYTGRSFPRELSGRSVKFATDIYSAEVNNVELYLHFLMRLYGVVIV